MELIDLLYYVELFQGLTKRKMKKLADSFVTQELKKDEILFHQGDKADKIYIVQSGFLEICIDKKVLGIFGPGQSIGEIAWLDHSKRSATARAIVDTIIPSISFTALTAFCDSNAKASYAIMRNLAADLSFRLRQRSES